MSPGFPLEPKLYFSPSGGTYPPIPRQLDEVVSGRVDNACGYRIPTRVSVSSTLASSSKTRPSNEQGGEGGCDPGSAKPDRKESNPSTSIPYSGFLQQHLCGPQERWGLAPSNKSKAAECLREDPSLQDGGDSEPERHTLSKGLHGKAGPQGCILECANAPTGPAVSEILLGGQSIRIFVPPFRPCSSSDDFYQTAKTGGHIPKETRNQSPHILGRHSPDGALRDRSMLQCQDHNEPVESSWLHPQHQEVSNRTPAVDRVLGIHGEYKQNDLVSPQRKGRESPERVCTLSEPIFGLSKATSPPDRPLNVLPTSSGTGSPALSGTATVEEPGSVTGKSIVRPEDSTVSRQLLGSRVVDQECLHSVNTPDLQSYTSPNARDRCVNNRLGSILSEHREVHRELLVQGRGTSPHQLARVKRSVSCPSVLHQTNAELPHFVTHGQSSGHCLPQQERGNKIQSTVRLGPEGVGLVYPERDHSRGTPPTGAAQHPGGFRESVSDRFQRLETRSSSLQGDHQAIGGLQHRPLCELQEHAVGEVLQLETRSKVHGSRCLVSELEGPPSSLPLSPILTDRSLPSEDLRGRCASCPPNCTTLACPNMVSEVVRDGIRRAKTPPISSEFGHKSLRRPPSATGTGPFELSGMEHIRKSLKTCGIHGQAADLYCASWRSSTTSSYSSCWQRWIKWCSTRKASPSEASIAQVIDFLTELYQEHKEYSTINSYRSAISAIHTKAIGQDQTLNRFMQGVFNCRPPKPRYSQIWDVSSVLDYMKDMDLPDRLPIQKLSQKVVTLLALSNADRASDLHLLSIDHMLVSEGEVKFQVDGLSKTRKSGPPREVVYPQFNDERICPVYMLKAYIKRTGKTRGGCNALFISCKKPHKQVATSTLSRWMKNMLEEAGIDTRVFKGHSVRTAAASAAHKAGASIKDILKAGNWRRESTFSRYYLKPQSHSDFSSSVLKGKCHFTLNIHLSCMQSCHEVELRVSQGSIDLQ